MSFLSENTKARLQGSGWYEHIEPFLESKQCKELHKFLAKRTKQAEVYPRQEDWFKALITTPFNDVNVVILAQDPYHGPSQANGLAFAVNKGRPAQPSLKVILKEVGADLGIPTPTGTTLEGWAKQGVLLLNSVLTTERGKAGAHANKGWESLTDLVVQALSQKRTGIVFMIWGCYAEKKVGHISYRHLKLVAGHPSPISAKVFGGHKHFSQANEWLTALGKDPIRWDCVETVEKSSLLDIVSGDDSWLRVGEVDYDDQY